MQLHNINSQFLFLLRKGKQPNDEDILSSLIDYALGVKQYGSMPYCILCLSVLQYIAILQYLIGFW